MFEVLRSYSKRFSQTLSFLTSSIWLVWIRSIGVKRTEAFPSESLV